MQEKVVEGCPLRRLVEGGENGVWRNGDMLLLCPGYTHGACLYGERLMHVSNSF